MFKALKADGGRKEEAMAEATQALDTASAWLETRPAGRPAGIGSGQQLRHG